MVLTFSDWIAITSLIFTIGGMTWIGVFQYPKLIHEVGSIKEGLQKLETRFEKLDARMDSFQAEMHKFDVRLTIIEQRKT